MASNLKYSVATKNQRLNQITSQIATSGFLKGYSGTQPTNPDTALSGNTLLFNLPLSATFAAASSLGAGGVLTANAISTEAAADGTGTLTWATLTTSTGGRVVDMSAGAAASTPDLTANSAAISSGAQVSCSSLTITAGN